jgi:crotonobetainyl-CoA:carnitine CoA-transferase CaiB-like acyl-CoA transferase
MSEFSCAAQLPLHGIKVIDFGQPIAGSAVGMVLGDLGATVVSIERIGSFAKKPAHCATLDRNKVCVELDLKNPDGLKQALELISTADVVIDSFRPGVMLKLGIDYALLCAAQPSLITMSIPGFASNDPVRRDWKGIFCAQSNACHSCAMNILLWSF